MKNYDVEFKSGHYEIFKAENRKDARVLAEMFARLDNDEVLKVSWGGKRANSGRKAKSPTVTLSFRVPAEKADDLKSKIKELIAAT